MAGALTAALALLLLHASYAGQPEGLDHEFTENERHYAFRGSFLVGGTEKCLVEVIYDFEHISRYATGARSIEKGAEGEDWYEVTYTYRRYLVLENRSTWRRTLNRARGRVDFVMTASENNLGVLPELLASSGYYQLAREGQGYRLEYFQECSISDGVLSGRYLKHARKGAVRLLEEFRRYATTTCR